MNGRDYRRFIAITFWVAFGAIVSLGTLAILTVIHFVVRFW
jgi:hypothetical protein